MVDSLLRLSFKVWNLAMGLGGFATISYTILMFRSQGENTSHSHHITVPWFFHAFLFVGIVLCAVTCLGHIAAHTANSCCLSTYIVVILVLLIVQTMIITGAFLRQGSEKELPLNLSDGDAVVSSYYIWKCLSSSVFLIQAVCVLLAALSFHVTNGVDDHDSEYEDDDNARTRIALLDPWPSARWQLGERNIV